MDKGAAMMILVAGGALALVIKAMDRPRRRRFRQAPTPQQRAERRQFTWIVGAIVLLIAVPLFLHYVLGWRV